MSDKAKCKNTIKIDRLKKLIDTKTREEIAKGIGCNTSLVTRHYNEDRTVTLEYVVKYAEYFKVSTDYLLGLSKDSTNDYDLKKMTDYTGLSKEAVCKLHSWNNPPYINPFGEIANAFLGSVASEKMAESLQAAYANATYLLASNDHVKNRESVFAFAKMEVYDAKDQCSKWIDSYLLSKGVDMNRLQATVDSEWQKKWNLIMEEGDTHADD